MNIFAFESAPKSGPIFTSAVTVKTTETGSISRWTKPEQSPAEAGTKQAEPVVKREPQEHEPKTEIKTEIETSESFRDRNSPPNLTALEKQQYGLMAASVSFYPEEAGYKAANVQYRKGFNSVFSKIYLNFFSHSETLRLFFYHLSEDSSDKI